MCAEGAGVRLPISAKNGQKDVKPVEFGSSDDGAGVDIVFPLDYLHAALGSVVVKAENHAINAGTSLLEQANTKAARRNTSVEADGCFHLNSVPEGKYLLKLTSVGDTEQPAGADCGNDLARMMHTKAAKSYGEAKLPVTVKSDATGPVLSVPGQPATTSTAPKAQPLSALLNQL
jgi:hypothetical protein